MLRLMAETRLWPRLLIDWVGCENGKEDSFIGCESDSRSVVGGRRESRTGNRRLELPPRRRGNNARSNS